MEPSRLSARASTLQALIELGPVGGLSDAELLERFAARDEPSVFEAIVRRHGAMVWGVCRRIADHHHDAEDAFQATFLVLPRKAGSIRVRSELPQWLHGVARRSALKVRSASLKRAAKLRPIDDLSETTAEGGSIEGSLDHLDREISRLPAKYRSPIILCELEGKTHRQAAEMLGWPVGTVAGRLSRARAILARRLKVPNSTLAIGPLIFGFPDRLVVPLVMSSVLGRWGRPVSGSISRTAFSLSLEVSHAMKLTQWKFALATAIGLGLVAAGVNAAIGPDDTPAPVPQGGRADGPLPIRGSIEGDWAIVEILDNGRGLPPGQKKEGQRATISSDRMTFLDGSRVEFAFGYRIESGRNPARLVLKGQKPGQEFKGLCKVDGDAMQLVYNEDPSSDIFPDRFVSEKANSANDLLMTLRRIKNPTALESGIVRPFSTYSVEARDLLKIEGTRIFRVSIEAPPGAIVLLADDSSSGRILRSVVPDRPASAELTLLVDHLESKKGDIVAIKFSATLDGQAISDVRSMLGDKRAFDTDDLSIESGPHQPGEPISLAKFADKTFKLLVLHPGDLEATRARYPEWFGQQRERRD